MRKTLASLAAGMLTAATAPAQMPPAVAPSPRSAEVIDRQVFLSATVVQMPVKLVEQLRHDHAVTETDPKAAAYPVADVAKLNDAIRSLKAGPSGIEILSQPSLMLTDRQTGFFQVGQHFPITIGDGPSQTVTHTSAGLTFRVIPHIAADAKSVTLKTELQLSSPNPTPVDLGNGKTATALDTQVVESMVCLDAGKTVVVPTEVVTDRNVVTRVRVGGESELTLGRRERTQLVLILTAETDPAKMERPVPPPVAVVPPMPAQACPVMPAPAVASPVCLPQPVALVSPALVPTRPAPPPSGVQVVCEILELPDNFWPTPGSVTVLHDPVDVTKFLTAARQEKTVRVATEAALRTTSGTPARVSVGGQRAFVVADAPPGTTLTTWPVRPTRTLLEVMPILCADRKVYLDVGYTSWESAGPVPPAVSEDNLKRAVMASSGKAVILVGPKVMRPNPVAPNTASVQRQQYLVVTPTCDSDPSPAPASRPLPLAPVSLAVFAPPAAQPSVARVYHVVEPVTPVVMSAAPTGELAGLLREYKSAIAAGNNEGAMKLALKALALDPGCFAK